MPRYMNLMSDYAFKRTFGSEKNKSILIQFLNHILNLEDKIVSLTFHDKESIPNTSDEKRVVYDIYCVTQHKRHIIVEIQRTIQPTFSDRALTYCCSLLMRQVKRGDRTYNLNDIYGIFIMDFHLLGHDPVPLREVGLYDFTCKERFSHRLNNVFLDLTMMNKHTFEECETDVERWLFLLKNIETMNSKPKGYPEFDELFDAADMSNLVNEEAVAYSESRQRMINDRQGIMEWGEIIREETRKEARKETLKSSILNMKNLGMAIDKIATLLGISPEEAKTIASV